MIAATNLYLDTVMLKRFTPLLVLPLLALLQAGCEQKPVTAPEQAAEKVSPAEKPATVRVRMQTTAGDIVLELNRAKAPLSVDNFLAYVESGHYTGTIFHRVIDNFMIQGGGYNDRFEKKPTRLPIQNEADNGLKNLRGTIAMARTNEPHSATAQFFINVKDNNFLDHRNPTPRGWGYTVFGKVIDGMKVVDKIKTMPTGAAGPFRSDYPKTPVFIENVTIETGSKS